jgi:hypothetical protein
MSFNDIDDSENADEGNVGLAFGQGFFSKSEIAFNEDTSEVMSYLMPAYGICVQAFLVDDFNGADDLGVEIIPNAHKGVSFIRIDRHLWDFVEDVAGCEHEASLYQGLILGELLVGTAHRMALEQHGQLPHF